MNTPSALFALLVTAVAAPAFAASAAPVLPPALPVVPATTRVTLPPETSWQFHRTDLVSADPDASATSIVNLPFDWSIAGPFDGDAPAKRGGAYLPTGAAQFRKLFIVPDADKDRRIEIQFDGIMSNGEVFINGQSLGKRPYGYTSVHYDLTPYLKYGSGNLNALDVNVDNSIQPLSRYYTGSGIERHVRLVISNPVHVETNGLYVTTPSVTPAKATVHFSTYVTNNSKTDGSFFVEAMVHGADGKMVGPAAKSAPQTIPAGKGASFEQDLTVDNPKLWDLDSPTLYKAMVAVVDNNAKSSGASGMTDARAIDVTSTTIGIRKIEFKPDSGFWLNDKNIKLLGVCLHEDGGLVGEAVPRAVYVERLTALKALGANAIRLAHNPPNPVELDVCDELGLLVMDEMFDNWTVSKPNAEKGYSMFFNDWSLKDLRDAVVRDRNHPSIILWSAGNEIHDTPQEEKARTILWGLVSAFHQYDPSRPVTQALFRPNTSHDYTNGLADMLDVIGTNYRDSELIDAQAAIPTRKIVNTEEKQDRATWLYIRDHKQMAGCFIWAGIDYLGEGLVANRPAGVDDPGGAWPNVSSGSGFLDRTLTPKSSGLERESWWSTKPVVHIVRNSGTRTANVAGGSSVAGTLNDWTPKPDSNYVGATVSVLSNCEEVELFLNGQSLGTKTLPADVAARVWEFTYAPGSLRAVGRNAGKEVAHEELKTAGAPAKVTLTTDRTSVSSSFDDVVFVHATVTDANGIRIPFADNAITFKVSGAGNFVAADNGKADDHTVFSDPTHTAKDGRVLALVRANDSKGKITVTASADGLTTGTLTLDAVPVK